jgi:phospholipid/cholesterol/gamma-HCH transport system ATP-binding protein
VTAPARTPQPAPRPTDGPAPTAPIVRFRNVCKRFGPLVIFDHLDLDVAAGKTTVILGPSGVGKSVLIKHIVGLLRPDSGEVWYQDRRIDRLPEREWGPIRREIGFVFQMAALFDSMTVRENLEFPLLEHTDLDPDARAEAVDRALHRVDLRGLEDRFPADLSGGQKKRVALARAIILEPRLILYDEPTTGLDPIRAAGIDTLINRLRSELGVSSIVVTHDLVSAQRVADHVALIYSGRIVAQGTMDQLRDNPDEYVQRFLSGGDTPTTPADSDKHAPARKHTAEDRI